MAGNWWNRFGPNPDGDKLNFIVYNFVDMLSHARPRWRSSGNWPMMRKAYRSLTMQWFQHSPLLDIFKIPCRKDCQRGDHQPITGRSAWQPGEDPGDRNNHTNLRTKTGKR